MTVATFLWTAAALGRAALFHRMTSTRFDPHISTDAAGLSQIPRHRLSQCPACLEYACRAGRWPAKPKQRGAKMSQQSSQTKSAELTIEALDRVAGGFPISQGFAQGAAGAASGRAAATA